MIWCSSTKSKDCFSWLVQFRWLLGGPHDNSHFSDGLNLCHLLPEIMAGPRPCWRASFLGEGFTERRCLFIYPASQGLRHLELIRFYKVTLGFRALRISQRFSIWWDGWDHSWFPTGGGQISTVWYLWFVIFPWAQPLAVEVLYFA